MSIQQKQGNKQNKHNKNECGNNLVRVSLAKYHTIHFILIGRDWLPLLPTNFISFLMMACVDKYIQQPDQKSEEMIYTEICILSFCCIFGSNRKSQS